MTRRQTTVSVCLVAAGLALLLATTDAKRGAAQVRAALPPSVQGFFPAPGDTTAWPGYIRHHAETEDLRAQIEELKAENLDLAEALGHLIVAARRIDLENRLVREYLKAQREKAEPWPDSTISRGM